MVNSLLLATIIRIGFIIISYGCKVPCGIFVPSMAVGACFGRMIGIVVKALHAWVVSLLATMMIADDSSAPDAPWFAACQPDAPCITPGTYAYLGAAAALRWVIKDVPGEPLLTG
jgi:chloride channel 3/4/5